MALTSAQRTARWKAKNRDKVKAQTARYLARYPGRNREWDAANPERRKQLNRLRYWSDREGERARFAAYRAQNAERLREANRQWHKDHPGRARLKVARRRARLADAPTVPFTPEQAQARWDYYGGRCWMCGGPATCWGSRQASGARRGAHAGEPPTGLQAL